jgi:hypothetical protein
MPKLHFIDVTPSAGLAGLGIPGNVGLLGATFFAWPLLALGIWELAACFI